MTLATEQAPALRVTGLHVTYGNFVAVERAAFTVQRGECVAIIGPNGNGKSTIAMAVAGILPRRGTIEIYGQVAPPGNPGWMVRHGLSLVPERRQLFPRLSVSDNMLLGCYGWTRSLRKARASEAFAEAVELFPELKPRMKQLVGTLSGGQQQMVALARGLSANPSILIADEPCLGLAEITSRRLYEALKHLNDIGKTVILVEENPIRALEICHRSVRVERGIAEDSVPPLAGASEGGGS